MRAFTSYGVAIVLVLLMAGWLGTGVLVQGGKGPEDGEQTVVSIVEEDGGPLTNMVEDSGMMKAVHHDEGTEALSIAERSATNGSEAGELRIVRVETFSIQPMALAVELRGTTAPKASVAVIAEAKGIVQSMAVIEGQNVEKGDLVCVIDQGTRQAAVAQAKASVAQAEAALIQAKSSFETNASLRAKGLASINSAEGFAASLRGAEAALEAAHAGLQNAESELEKTEVRAGLSGIVQRPIAEVGNYMNIGTPCATIVQMDPMLFTGAIPQARIDLARIGMPATITTINDKTAQGEVSYIALTSNAATRTFEFEIEFPNPNTEIFGGLTATAAIDMGNVPAHLIPQSTLTLSADGTLGIQAVKDSVVEFHPITILRDTRDGVWVTGLPLILDIIILGQEYVKPGQTVDAQKAE